MVTDDGLESIDARLRAAAAGEGADLPRCQTGRRISDLASEVVRAIGIGTCAGAPEFIWNGFNLFLESATWLNLLSALLIGLVFVFFVEPIFEGLREMARGAHPAKSKSERGNLLFSAGLGIAFGVISVCLHEAISAFVAGHGATDPSGLREAIRLAAAWATVPFFIAIAWQSADRRRLAIPTGIAAALSPYLAAWIFGWRVQTVVATAVPSLTIQLWGYQHTGQASPTGHAVKVLLVAVAWLLLASLVDGFLAAYHLNALHLYSYSGLLVDIRFYTGCIIGLLLAPSLVEGGKSIGTDNTQAI